ncbi:putative dehydrogenase [Novosphingobium hassiacum]|uniref:Putative dehydrogenase n=1 Tax=Novosphingobium hassiacum TaxID=173676 RepID=A0A7W6EWK5_9SPHN|nr:Gfo/Idh/MocA family oxidoreductase [Novosphingobium hassiacum]MBB3860944.1 putative dehydrogenase [Novosphingobium hassiacum]
MRVAVVGTGMFSRITALPGIALAKTAELGGVFDLAPEAARAAAEAYDTTCFDSLDALLASGPDLVYLSTPPSSHVVLLDRVIDAGRNVLCEKPMCSTTAEVETAQARAEARGLLHAVDHEWRYTSAYRTIRQMVQDGTLGTVRNVNVSVCVNYGVVEGWPPFYASFATMLAESGGVVPQLLSHFCDLFEFMFGGLAASGAALATMIPYKPLSPTDPTLAFVDGEDSCALSGFLPNGAPVAISASWVAAAPTGAQWTITGSKESVIYRTGGLLNGGKLGLVTSDFALRDVDQLPEYNPCVFGDGGNREYQHGLFAAEIEDIAAALASGRTTGQFATFADEVAVRRNIEHWRSSGIRAASAALGP